MNRSTINLHLGDSLEAMKEYPDNHWDLAICDPPYGIGHSLLSGESRGSKFVRNERHVDWDIVPSKEYWNELFRVSKNQIIWGGNYFIEYLDNTKCFLMWDKMQEFSGSDFELAWTSFEKPSKAFRMSRVESYSKGKIHPTQKPVKLYEWLLKNYAKEGDKILDTHGGSMSIALACHNLKYDLDLWELDADYHAAGVKRFEQHKKQLQLF